MLLVSQRSGYMFYLIMSLSIIIDAIGLTKVHVLFDHLKSAKIFDRFIKIVLHLPFQSHVSLNFTDSNEAL